MKKENRTEIRCSKTLASGVVDSFSVIVPTSARNDAKKNMNQWVIQYQWGDENGQGIRGNFKGSRKRP